MSKQILILDDDADLRRDHVAKLKSLFNSQDVFTVREMTVDEFRKGLDRLEQRQAMARKRGPIDLELTCCFDQADVLVVESDLVPLRA
ncbi:MAG: hypothetical protein P4L81_02380, partial [Candidatus Pacebacteria bacterium]|nr:hypothetical protein [Candidatus Paceibacterota bacterium]